VSTAAALPKLPPALIALAKRLLDGPIDLEETTPAEDRALAKLEELDLVVMGTTTARLSDQWRALEAGASAVTETP